MSECDVARLRGRVVELADEVEALGKQIEHTPAGSPAWHELVRLELSVSKELARVYAGWLLATEPEPPASAWN